MDSARVAIIGKCVEFTPAYDNEPEEAAITLENPMKGTITRAWFILAVFLTYVLQ